ncbi:3-deoxy-manno-octulosonate-8-phosphatase [Roseivirga sp. 4D4]|uniref:KdsC family phosphatase n=1 Tax=Roseivirga sp. 4D4 TaxID=1889784 RepID=UPI00085393BA|nr:HAD hydrolase family protein [Roseivirga sp. 4D4]OEK01649.1 3-deoxy-manno-octulosonate-8-phosphatase [Roseivirga sp. 4D4]
MKDISPEILEKAKRIKLIIFDVDGVLTDGGIIYDNAGQEYKRFNVKDGQIIKYLREFNILTGVITGRDSQVVRNRCNELKIDFHHHGIENKVDVFKKVLDEFKLSKDEVAYVGDDINDLPILVNCGLSTTPADGHNAVKKYVDHITKVEGGKGVLRELADLVLYSQGYYDQIINDLTSNGDF